MTDGFYGYGDDEYGVGPYGSPPSFGVASAEALTPTTVRVNFTDRYASSSATVDPSNYSITNGIGVYEVLEETEFSVVLVTDYLARQTYSVVVTNVVSRTGDPLDVDKNRADFPGFPDASTSFIAVALSEVKITLTFNKVMEHNAALDDHYNYQVFGIDGQPEVPVLEVIVDGDPGAPTSISLVLGDPLVSDVLYRVDIISDEIKTQDGGLVRPQSACFIWISGAKVISVPTADFTGEAHGNIFGEHNGLVFFSPSFKVGVANSTIEIDFVTTCTTAFDEYDVPSQIGDLEAFHTYGTGKKTYLINGPAVFRTNSNRLGGTRMDFVDKHEDFVSTPVSSRGLATLAQPLDPSRISRLNTTSWPLFGPGVVTPFIAAANLTSIPPGPTTTRTLEP
jgi:hypothetical protein